MSDFSRGQLLKQGRINANLSLEQVAKKLGVNRSTVSRWETGKIDYISLPVLRELSAIYNIEPGLLIDTGLAADIEVIHASPSYSQLSDQEHFLISLFRKMTDKEREKLIKTLLSNGNY